MSKILQGDCLEVLKTLPDKSVDCCITSPPYYGLRDYGTGEWVGGDPNCPHKRLSKYSPSTTTGHAQEELRGNVGDAIYKAVCPLCGAVRVDKQIGLEETPEQYVQKLVDVFHEVKRVLKDDGTLWLNLGDSYWGSGSRGFDFTDVFTEASKLQQGSKGTIDLHNLPKLVGNVDGYKNKDLIGIPWMVAFALRADGWYLRQDIIWHKPNPMPESVKDRCTKSHEYIFLLSKKPHYYFDYEAIQEPAVGKYGDDTTIKFGGNKYGDNEDSHFQTYSGNTWKPKHKNLMYDGQAPNTMHKRRAEGLPDEEYTVRNKRDVWSITTKAVKEAHFATYPEELVEPCVKAGSRVGGVVLDPFFGSGTTGKVAEQLNREYIGIDLNPEYIEIAKKRTSNLQMSLEGLMKVGD